MVSADTLAAVRLPSDFQFSQVSLGDFVECKRRFQLRYLWKLSWPAVQSEPYADHENAMQRGVLFHRLAQQFLEGVPKEQLSRMIEDDLLAAWWDSFIEQVDFIKPDRMSKRYTEVTLSTRLAGYRLVGKFDLLVVHKDCKLTIVDWKTSQFRPRRDWLKKRMQTHVYPYLLVLAGASLIQNSLTPEQVELLYWYPNYPTQAVSFEYDQDQYQKDDDYLKGLVKSIEALDSDAYDLTNDEKSCRFCVYRSLCDRGVQAGSLSEVEDELVDEELVELMMDFDRVGEIEF